MADVLAPVLEVSALYEYRREVEAPPVWVPYNQGDVFENAPLPSGGTGLAMLFMHPCTMRRGPVLRDRVTVLAVEVRHARRVLNDEGHWSREYRVFPLPDLLGGGIGTWAANFMEIGTVDAEALDRRARVASLSAAGRLTLQQRAVHHLTRFAPQLDTLARATAAVEAELVNQADWVEAACVAAGAESEESVRQAETQYDEFLSASPDWSPGDTRRSLLAGEHRAQVTRDIQREIRNHF